VSQISQTIEWMDHAAATKGGAAPLQKPSAKPKKKGFFSKG
jgi:hypothetical protein